MGRSLRKTAYVVVACALLLTGTAAAQVAAPPVVGTGGGVPVASSPASVARLACAQRCGSAGAVRPGSMLRVRGKTLSRADQVVFLGAAGEADDIAAALSVRRKTSVDVRVPFGAAGGPVAVVDRDGARTLPSVAPVTVEATPAGAAPTVEFAVRAPRFVYDAAQPAALTYVVHGSAPVDVAIDLVRAADGVVIGHWDTPQVPPEAPQVVTWDGIADGKIQETGRYVFRVAAGGVLASAFRQTVGPDPAAFDFARDRFPILGPSRFGTAAAAFGGGRGHQGHDVFAKCGTLLVAAHGGVVKYAGYHGRAGNYLVIDGEGVDTDHAYMHLRDVALVKTGDRVRTGQPIGFVGDTGSASACHLHFEIWTAPGWYSGGQPVDPLPIMKSWL